MDLHSIKDELAPVVQEILKDQTFLDPEYPKCSKALDYDAAQADMNQTAINDANISILADQIINILITNDLFKMQLEGMINQALERKLEKQEQKIEQMEQYSRRSCIVIHGLECKADEDEEHEDTDETAINFFKTHLNIDMDKNKLDRSHRLPSKNKPLIVKFVRHNVKTKILAAKRRLKGKSIYITESLTKTRLNCVSRLKNYKDEKLISAYWTWDEKIYYTKEKHGKVFTVKNFLDFELV